MRTRNPSPRTWSRWLIPAAVSTALFGCPNQELAPLTPCTVSGVSLEVPQSGVDKVDVLFMIDNSGSMSEEQKKLAEVLDDMVAVLTTGNKNGQPSPAGMKPDFPPVQSLHIGVVSSDMGVNGAVALPSCGDKSFIPEDPDPSAPPQMRVVKPFGDDGVLQISTKVAVAGIFAPPSPGATPVNVVPGDPNCAGVTFPPGQRYIDFKNGETDPRVTAQQFGCIAKLGRNGCGLEQQLEAVLKALTPPDSGVKFSQVNYNGVQSPNGHGNPAKMGGPTGPNAGFLREDSILAIILVSDEEDCSIPDASRAIFDSASTAVQGGINVRCGLAENQRFLHNVKERYAAGLKALKPAAYQDRIIVASIVGVPVRENTGAKDGVTSGAANIDKILARPDMQFKVQMDPNNPIGDKPVPTCVSARGDGDAAPARRFLELTKEFGDNGVVTSICEDEYKSALNVITDKIASQLTGACLPRKLSADADGKVACDVVEIKAENSAVGCDASKGRVETLPSRKINGKQRTVCRMQQVPRGMGGEGWYYDDFTDEVLKQCQKNPQRIAFTANANPDPGAQAKFECFQPVASGVDAEDKGRDAINLSCARDPRNMSAPFGDDVCSGRAVNGAPLICVNDSCQLSCTKQSECPAGWLCEPTPDKTRRYCINPTCPPASQ